MSTTSAMGHFAKTLAVTQQVNYTKVDGEVTMIDEKPPEFYKEFYEQNRVALLQYESLRSNFSAMVTDTLGEDYYNIAMDVYDADRICCEDITIKCNESVITRFFNLFKWAGK